SSILCFSCYLFFTSVTSTLYFTFFFFNDTATTEIYTLSLHDALPIYWGTDLVAGARFKYGLLWVVGLASLMAIFMQIIAARLGVDRKSTRLNSSHDQISYAVFCLKKKKKKIETIYIPTTRYRQHSIYY